MNTRLESPGGTAGLARPEAPPTREALPHPPRFLPHHWVEVLGAEELLATLDGQGALGGLPFMPEMLKHCGQRFQVSMCAETVCVFPPRMPFRRLSGCVVLEGLRCDGSAHGGCQLGCMFLWKEAWLKRVDGPFATPPAPRAGVEPFLPVHPEGRDAEYFCQATELSKATGDGDPFWKPGQYLSFLNKRTFRLKDLVAMFAGMGLRRAGKLCRRWFLPPPKGVKDLPGPFGLKPGQWVKIREKREILELTGPDGTAQGLPFTGEMFDFCGRTMKVQRNITLILEEHTGLLRPIVNTVTLEHALCDRYLGCARGMPFLWREAWLEPIPGAWAAGPTD